MSLFDHPEVETIFDEVVVITDLQLQAQLLAERCGDNLALRQRVESLLRAYTTSDFLENSVAEMGLLSSDLQPSLPIGAKIQDWRFDYTDKNRLARSPRLAISVLLGRTAAQHYSITLALWHHCRNQPPTHGSRRSSI